MSIAPTLKNSEISLDSQTVENLDRFTELLSSWNMTHSITGAKTIQAIEDNIIDALLPINFIDFPQSVIDIGTGAGFPGLVLAIVLPTTKFTLCEPLQKRTAFLRYVIMELGLSNVKIEPKRVEKLEDVKFELITSRAVTNTKLLLDLTDKIRNQDTQYLLYKGSRVFDELEDIAEHNPIYDIIQKNFRNYLHIKSLNAI